MGFYDHTKRVLGVLAFVGIGGFLALLATWITSPSCNSETSQVRIPLPSARAASQDAQPENPRLRSELRSSGESGELGRVDTPTEVVAVPTPNTGGASPPVDRIPATVGVTDENGPAFPGPNEERPLGWCFHTTLDGEFRSDSDSVFKGARSVLIGKHRGAILPDLRVSALWQSVDATQYRNLRLEVSAHVKGGGGVFVFLQTATEQELALGNGPIRIASSTNRYFQLATAEWTRLSIVTDVPRDAYVMYYGLAQNGSASLWVDDFHVAEAGSDSPTTQTPSQNAPVFLSADRSSSILPSPANLSFELTDPDVSTTGAADPAAACNGAH